MENVKGMFGMKKTTSSNRDGVDLNKQNQQQKYATNYN